MSRLWGALTEALSLILAATGAAFATRLYPEHSPAVVGALITILGAVLYSLATRLSPGGAKRKAPKARWNRHQWKWVLILLVPSIFQGQVHQAALESVNIGTLMTVVTLGALGLAAWRLLFSAHRSRVRWHALWFVIGVAGVILLTRPFTDGAEIVGLALAGVAAVIGVNATIASGRLTEMGALSRVVELNCWGAACLVGVPVLVWTDDHWVTGYVLSTVAVTSLLNMIANKLHVRAYELVQSDDGLMSSVKCLNPVLACLVGIAVGQAGRPGSPDGSVPCWWWGLPSPLSGLSIGWGTTPSRRPSRAPSGRNCFRTSPRTAVLGAASRLPGSSFRASGRRTGATGSTTSPDGSNAVWPERSVTVRGHGRRDADA